MIKRLLLILIAVMFFSDRPTAVAYSYGMQLYVVDSDIGLGVAGDQELRLFTFNVTGKFLKERRFPVPDNVSSPILLGSSGNGFWVFMEELDKEYKRKAAILRQYGPGDKVMLSYRIEGHWVARFGEGQLYVMESDSSSQNIQSPEITIYNVDSKTGELTPYVTLPKGERSILDWYSSPARVYLLVEEKTNTYLEAYSSSGGSLWKIPVLDRPIEETSMQIEHVTTGGDVYLLSGAGEKNALLISVESKGRLKFSRPQPELIDMIQGRADLFGLTNYRIKSLSGKQVEWSCNPPIFGETWEEKWRQEKLASRVTAASTTQKLLIAFAYSMDQQQSSRIQRWLSEREEELPHLLIPAVLKYPNSNLEYLLYQIQESKPEVVNPEIEKIFESASYADQKVLFRFLVSTKRPPTEALKQFLEEMRKGNDEEREMAESALLYMGLDSALVDNLMERLRNSSTKEERAIVLWTLLQSPDASLAQFEILLNDPSNKFASEVQNFLMQNLSYAVSDVETSSSAAMVKLEEWASKSDSFVSKLAILVLASAGKPDYFSQALSIAQKDDEFRKSFLTSFYRVAKENPTEAEAAAAEVLSLAISHALYDIKDAERSFMLFTLASTNLPGMHKLMLDAAFNSEIDPRLRPSILYALSPVLDNIDKGSILKLIRSADLSVPGDRTLYLFFRAVGTRFANDSQIREAVRSRLIYDLSRAESNDYAEILAAFTGFVELEDLPILYPFLEMENVSCGGYLVDQALNLIAEVEYQPEVEDRIYALMNQTGHAVPAAKVLALGLHPEALDILIRAVKSGNEHNLDARFFKGYGSFAENQLLGLLHSEKPEVRDRAILLLGQLKNIEARAWAEQRFDHTVKSRKVPPFALMSAMMDYGLDPFGKLMLSAGEFDFCSSFSDQESFLFSKDNVTPATLRLEALLMKEQSLDQAKSIVCLLVTRPFVTPARKILENAATNHPVEAVRQYLPEVRTGFSHHD